MLICAQSSFTGLLMSYCEPGQTCFIQQAALFSKGKDLITTRAYTIAIRRLECFLTLCSTKKREVSHTSHYTIQQFALTLHCNLCCFGSGKRSDMCITYYHHFTCLANRCSSTASFKKSQLS